MKNGSSSPQTRISSYFSQASSLSPSKGGKNRSSPIDLTGEADSSDSEPPPKKRKITTPSSPVLSRTSEWQYTPGPNTETTAAKSPTRSEIDAKKKRQEAFRKKLLADDHRFSRQASSTREPEQDEVEELSGTESDDEFKALTKMFSAKGQNAKKVSKKPVRTKSAPKVAEENGPCGQPYTPLEKQVSIIFINRQHIKRSLSNPRFYSSKRRTLVPC